MQYSSYSTSKAATTKAFLLAYIGAFGCWSLGFATNNRWLVIPAIISAIVMIIISWNKEWEDMAISTGLLQRIITGATEKLAVALDRREGNELSKEAQEIIAIVKKSGIGMSAATAGGTMLQCLSIILKEDLSANLGIFSLDQFQLALVVPIRNTNGAVYALNRPALVCRNGSQCLHFQNGPGSTGNIGNSLDTSTGSFRAATSAEIATFVKDNGQAALNVTEVKFGMLDNDLVKAALNQIEDVPVTTSKEPEKVSRRKIT